MSDRRRNRTNTQLKARANQIKSRMPDRLPEIKAKDVRELGKDIGERVPELGKDIRKRSKTARDEIAKQYAKMDVSWARCRHVRARPRRAADVRAQPADGPLHAPPHGRARRLRRTSTRP